MGLILLFLLAVPAAAQPPPPRPLSILDVPFISQSEALCGGAAAAMVLRYWGERGLTAESFAHLLDPGAGGIRTDRLVEDLNARGWKAVALDGTDQALTEEMARGRPVLALIEDRPGTFHYVVIVAATPQVIVFHDPARSPFRAMERSRFQRRWASAGRWMAVVVPGAPRTAAPPPALAIADADSCEGLVATGVRLAQANDLDAAEQSLTRALSCGGPAPLRELAGVRLLQQRWPEVGELARAALDLDGHDSHAWELLATSRFVQGDAVGALGAWNQIDRPRVDLVSVGGLSRTRQRVVERLLAVPAQTLLTPGRFALTARRLRELPAASSTRLDYVPSSSGLAELQAHVVERPLVPRDPWSYVALGLVAGARNEVSLSSGSVTGGGERMRADWRFWPGRPRVGVEVAAPAPWGGVWAVDAFGERQPFTVDAIEAVRRTGVGATLSNWVAPWLRVTARGGLDDWEGRGTFGVVSAGFRLASRDDRVVVGVDAAGWSGAQRFGSFSASTRVLSSTSRRGALWIARAGVGALSSLVPPDMWVGGDTGRTRPALLRAHPVIDAGRLDLDRVGRGIVHGSLEGQVWWETSFPVRLAAAAFVDAAEVRRRLTPGSIGDVDTGLGLRLAVPGLAGVFRLDLAKGLRDGATAFSFVYEP